MYRSHAGSCPSCGSTLTPLPTTLTMSGCFACGGVWLGPDAAVHVLRGLGDELEESVAAASAETARRSTAPSPDSGARECPTCGLVMARLPVGDVVLDSCATHGSFFDRDEVQAVTEACRRLRKRHAPGLANDLRDFVGGIKNATARMVGKTFAALADELDAVPKPPGSD